MRFGLIGYPLGHSFSVPIHEYLGDYEYRLYPLKSDQLDAFMRENTLDGFNVTIPYKTAVMPYCSALSKRAEKIGSVNTVIRRPDGTYFGDNTDYFGFHALLGADAECLRGQKALILGSGGTEKAVRTVLTDSGIKTVTVSRTGENNYENLFRHTDAKLIVNTTPVGMYPQTGVCPIDLKPFTACALVLDMIYNPSETRLLFDARMIGIPARNGLLMLVAQAKAASEQFTGQTLPDSKIKEVTNILMRQTKNVVLIGMPGCGKSSVGRTLATLTDRPFIDTDELVREKACMSIPEIFQRKGEKAFRDIETAVLKKIGKQSGAVIAAGGGVVTVPENRYWLAQNGTVVLLNYDLDKLDTSGRPLSFQKSPHQLYAEREALYKEWSDYTFYNADISETAVNIKNALKL